MIYPKYVFYKIADKSTPLLGQLQANNKNKYK